MDQLYMLELLVNRVVFPSLPVPQKKQIIVQATCGTFANMEIRTDVMGALETQERNSKRIDVDIDCGKSLVFPMNSTNLITMLNQCPLQISVSTKLQTEPIGTASIPWSGEFIEMIESSKDAFGYVTPVEMRDMIPLEQNGNPAGSVEIYVRLTFLGKNIDTHIQVIDAKGANGAPGGTAKQFLFKSNNAATTFQCQKYGLGSDTEVIPVAPIYGVSGRANNKRENVVNSKSIQSIMGGTSIISSQSMTPSVFRIPFGQPMINLQYGLLSSAPSDTQSLRVDKHVDNRFMNLLDFDTVSSISSECVDGEVDFRNLTIQAIEKNLCQHPDCPAAKLFKNFGIGPLAKGNGLGGLYRSVEAPISYGMSHMNGRIDNYGPLGMYSRPKSPDQPFTPKNSCKEDGESGSTDLKSNSGNSDCNSCEPLRLNGGGPPVCGSENIPNPKDVCKDLMDEFNRLLAAYKNALGPCGQPTCPFAPNLVIETCKLACGYEEDTTTPMSPTPVEVLADMAPQMSEGDVAGCSVATCPFKRDVITPSDKDHKKKQSRSACGSPTCPYTREKLGLEEVDDAFMPPLPCIDKKCPYNARDELPPIHWDCPDPLPKGDCTNPDCPYVKKQQLLDKYYPKPKTTCGSPTCPYSVVPCIFPGCPFNDPDPCPGPCPPICPYTAPVPSKLECTPSVCPFARVPPSDTCQDPSCPYNKTQSQAPTCPPDPSSPPCPPKPTCPPQVPISCPCATPADNSCVPETCPFSSPSSEDPKQFGMGDERKKTSQGAVTSGVPCTKETCVGFSGNLVCHECGDSLDQNKVVQPIASTKPSSKTNAIGTNQKAKKDNSESAVLPGKQKKDNGSEPPQKSKGKNKNKKKKRKRKRCGYLYDKGTYYPGNKIGHRECIVPKFNVPPDMGWLWNVHTTCVGLRPRMGWKPGAIGRTIAHMIDKHRAKLGLDPISQPPAGKRKSKRGRGGDSSSDSSVQIKPTLQVKKKDGIVYVTMNPLKDPKTLEDNENPYMDCSPMQFKIVKNKPTKDGNGFKSCICGDEDGEGKELSSSSSSELDIEFTPPAGIIRPERLRKKKNVCHTDTQYNIDDCGLKPIEPPKKVKGKGTVKGKGGKKGKT